MGQKILLIDDSEFVHKVFGVELQKEGFEVISVQDALQSINTALKEQPDLIILDVQMPKINGYQVCRLLKDHNATSSIPIIIMTGSSGEDFVKNPESWSFETGADGYFDKNEPENFIEYVKKILSEHPAVEKKKDVPLMTDEEVMASISGLLDKQLYEDITRLKELDDKKNSFVGNVSHELKSPLQVIRGSLENMRDGILGEINDDQKIFLEAALRNISRLNRLIIDLLDLAKIEAGHMKLKQEEIDINKLIQDVEETYRFEADRNKINLCSKLPEECCMLLGDWDRLQQVVINLLSNCLKFTPEGGEVVMVVESDGEEVDIQVKDTGPGISKENLEKIFDKFQRITAEKKEGTGLGLAIAKDIVDLHKGHLWAESELGKGTTFCVTLPIGKLEEIKK